MTSNKYFYTSLGIKQVMILKLVEIKKRVKFKRVNRAYIRLLDTLRTLYLKGFVEMAYNDDEVIVYKKDWWKRIDVVSAKSNYAVILVELNEENLYNKQE